MILEIFKPVNDERFKDNYEISNLGNVRSTFNGVERILKHIVNSAGYHQVILSATKKERKHFLVARLVASHFIENPNNYDQILFKDNDKSNLCYTNLEWAEHSQVMKNAAKNKAMCYGEAHHKTKFTNDEIKDIKNSELSIIELSRIYNVRYSAIHNIISGRSWKNA